jgi:hypothetical protein
MKKNYTLLLGLIFLLSLGSFAQTDADATNDASPIEKKEKKKKEKDPGGVKTGWTFGVLPSVAFDADLGFQYGVLGNVFYYGDGSTYPNYMHSMYFEAAYTTKRYGLFRFCYDSKYLIPKHRFSFDITYVPDSQSDFLGYNGYQSVYNEEWRRMSTDKKPNPEYKSRAYYKYKRDLLRVAPDISGTIKDNWKWAAGIGLLAYWTGSVDTAMFNKKKPDEKKLTLPGLYDQYVSWNIIHKNEAGGGIHPYVRGGFVYDSRNRQINASTGMYADAFFTYTAGFGKSSDYNNLKFNAVYQHYVPVYKEDIVFAYRAGVQLLVTGNSPFYLDNYLNMLYYQRVLYEAVGGANSVRGLIRNRITAEGFGYATVEFRIKAFKFDIAKQHFYIGFNPFCDMGIVLQPKKVDQDHIENIFSTFSTTEKSIDDYFDFDKKQVYLPHFGAGLGLKIAMNENFILSVDWAMPVNKKEYRIQDNHSMANIYIKMGYLF